MHSMVINMLYIWIERGVESIKCVSALNELVVLMERHNSNNVFNNCNVKNKNKKE